MTPGTYLGSPDTLHIPVAENCVIVVLQRGSMRFQAVIYEQSIHVRRYYNSWGNWTKIGPA